MDFSFNGELFEWRGPSPYYFLAVPAELCDEIRERAAEVTYGWGMVPVVLRLGATKWETSLWPKDGGYLVPIKDRIRKAEDLQEGDTVTVKLGISARGGRPAGRGA